MRKSWFTRGKVGLLVGLLIGSTWTVSAQKYYGPSAGTGTGSSCAFLPKVSLTATDLRKGIETTGVTTEAGIYQVPALTPDTYKLEARATKFKKLTRGPL